MSSLFPPAPPGTFRLFRLLALYPIPRIYLQTFPLPKLDDTLHAQTQLPSDAPIFSCPTYDAISYAWNPVSSPDWDQTLDSQGDVAPGQEIQTYPIIITAPGHGADITINITNHLLYGLITIQELCSPTWLFVDAICIEQADTADKAVQVQSMNRVFRGAQKVLIWLGIDLYSDVYATTTNGMVSMGNNHSDMVMGACLSRIPSLVQVLEAYCDSCKRDQKQQDSSKKGPRHVAAAAVDLIAEYDALWSALERLRSNPWFFRLWVVQEVALAQDAILVYGNEMLPWSVYAKLTALCETIITSLFSQNHDLKLVNRLYFAYNSRVSAMIKSQVQLSHSFTLNCGRPDDNLESVSSIMTVIHTIRKSRVTVPLDRVYAVMGMLSDRMRESIQVDYSNTLTENCGLKWLEFFQVILSLVPLATEEIFSLATSLQPYPDLPSWCPNLLDDADQTSVSGPLMTCAGMPKSKEWVAPEGTRVAEVILGSSCLRLLGLRVDEVARVIDLSWIEASLPWPSIIADQDNVIDSGVAQEILATLWRCIEAMRELGVPMANADAILAKCVVANAYDDQVVNATQIQQDYLAFARWLEHHIWGAMTSGPLRISTKRAAMRFGNRFQRMIRKRAFFVTRAGRSGLCSVRASEGDALCVFMNFRLPYLLRAHEDPASYESVGEAYVDGLMYGEAFKDHDMNKEIPGEFIIS